MKKKIRARRYICANIVQANYISIYIYIYIGAYVLTLLPNDVHTICNDIWPNVILLLYILLALASYKSTTLRDRRHPSNEFMGL